MGILAERTGFEVSDLGPEQDFEFCKVFKCRNKSKGFPNSFACLFADTSKIDSERDAQGIFAEILEILQEEDLQDSALLTITQPDFGHLGPLLNLSRTIVPMTVQEFLEVLLAHPPRTALAQRIRGHTPLTILNPFVYKGPIGPDLFVGRREQLDNICELKASHALIGPRAIGKTSLMNRAYERLRREGQVVVQVELSKSMRELDLAYQIIDRFIREHGADRHLYGKVSVSRVALLVEDYVLGPKRKKILGSAANGSRKGKPVVIFIDEADELVTECPSLADILHRFHNQGFARLLLLGYKGLRKIVSNASSPLMNVLEELPLSGFSLRECAPLIVDNMVKIGIELEDPEKIVEIIHRDSGGCPSRVQMLCHFLVEAIDSQKRKITPADAEKAINLPSVRKELGTWFSKSTTPVERWLAGLAALRLPCEETALIEDARKDSFRITSQTVREEIQDLITANVISYREDGRLDFAFPKVRELARPLGNTKEAMTELRRLAHQSQLNDTRTNQ